MKFDELKCELGLMDIESSDADTSGLNGWAVPWSDLMMVMFVLFVVLFIYSQSKEDIKIIFEQNAQTSVADNPAGQLVEMISFHRDAMSSDTAVMMTPQDMLYRSDDGAVSMNEEDGEMRIVMRGDAFFVAGSSQLNSRTRKYLSEVAKVLKTNNHAIHIMGHADSGDTAVLGAGKAFELSAVRAAGVAEYLMKEQNIDPVRIIVSGRGNSAPELPDSIEKVKGNNRRVEIIVINTDISSTN